MEYTRIKITDLRLNRGQIPGVRSNPRRIDRDALDKLRWSIAETPELLDARGLIVYPYEGAYVVLGGNMRFRACKLLGINDVPCVVLPQSMSADKLNQIVVKDNGSFGWWDVETISAEWGDMPLDDWGVPDLPAWESKKTEKLPDTEGESDEKTPIAGNDQPEDETDDKVEDKKNEKAPPAVTGPKKKDRKAWCTHEGWTEAVCDLVPRPTTHRKGRFCVSTIWSSSDTGIPIRQLKSVEYVDTFAKKLADAILALLGLADTSTWCIITTPKRRHTDWNFAEEVARRVGEITGLLFVADVVIAKNHKRINPDFELVIEPPTPNVVVVDDIFTTGSTLEAMDRLLAHKNRVYLCAISNRRGYSTNGTTPGEPAPREP